MASPKTRPVIRNKKSVPRALVKPRAPVKPGITCRAARQADLRQLLEIDTFDVSRRPYHRRLYRRLIAEKRILCAAAGKRVIAVLYWRESFLGRTNLWYLWQVTVKEDWRGSGVGKLLFRHFLDHARDRGVEKVFSLVQNGNLPSLKMHLGLGGLVSGTIDGLTRRKGKDERVFIRFPLNVPAISRPKRRAGKRAS